MFLRDRSDLTSVQRGSLSESKRDRTNLRAFTPRKKGRPMSSVKLDTTKRNSVRLALVTGSTVAAIIGAQSLIALDKGATTPTASAASQTNSSFQSQQSNSSQSQFFGDDGEGGQFQEISPGVFLFNPTGQSLQSSQSSQSFSNPTTQTIRRPRTRSSR
jgi:hypothetical protein